MDQDPLVPPKKIKIEQITDVYVLLAGLEILELSWFRLC